MYLCAIEFLGVAVVVEYIPLVRGVANFCCLVVSLYGDAVTLVLDGIALLDVHRLILVLLVEATAVCIRYFWSVLVSVCDTLTVQNGGHVLVVQICFDKRTNTERRIKCEVKARHIVEL